MKKENQKSKYKKIPYWQSWRFLMTIIIVVIVGGMILSERASEYQQPSKEWSHAIDLAKDLPLDERLTDDALASDGQALAYAYVTETGIKVLKIGSFGEVIQEVLLPIPTKAIKLVQLEPTDQGYILYLSDRVTLDRYALSDDFVLSEKQRVSDAVEHFHARGSWVVAGNDQKTTLYRNLEAVTSDSGYMDLRGLNLLTTEANQYFVINAESGANVYKVTTPKKGTAAVKLNHQDVVKKVFLTNSDLSAYGFIKDMIYSDNQLTLMSLRYNRMKPDEPSILGVWHLDGETLADKSVDYFYHVATSLDPVLVSVTGDKTTYALGSKQRMDPSGEGLSRYPQTAGGKITNVSLITREGDQMVKNTRLTMTRQYTLTYNYVTIAKTPVLIWVDKNGTQGHLRITGKSPDWIKAGKQKLEVDWLTLFISAVMGIGNGFYLGAFSLVFGFGYYNFVFIALGIFSFLYMRYGPFEPNKKATQLFYLNVGTFSVIKWYVFGFQAITFRDYAYIYPWLFGSDFALSAMVIGCSVLSFILFKLWHREHIYHTKRNLHFRVYLAFEIVLLLATSFSYLLNAMMKIKFMV